MLSSFVGTNLVCSRSASWWEREHERTKQLSWDPESKEGQRSMLFWLWEMTQHFHHREWEYKEKGLFSPVSSEATAQCSNSKYYSISKYPILASIHIYYLFKGEAALPSAHAVLIPNVPTIMKQSYPPGPNVDPRVFYAQIDEDCKNEQKENGWLDWWIELKMERGKRRMWK